MSTQKTNLMVLIHILPFANDIANVVSRAFPSLSRVYDTSAHGLDINIVPRYLIDLVALSSIVWVSLLESEKTDKTRALLYGVVTLVFSFVLPAIIIGPILKNTCVACPPAVTMGLGVVFVAAIFFAEQYTKKAIFEGRDNM